MQTVNHSTAGARLATAALALFPGLGFSQAAVPEAVARPALFSPLQTGLLSGVAVLFLLLGFCAISLSFYRKRFLIFSKRCEVLGPQLNKIKRELRGMKALLKEEAERHGRMIDDAGVALFQLNEEGECVYVNSAMSSLSGLPKHRLFDQGLLDAVYPEDREKVCAEWVSFASRQAPYESSYRLQRKDGSVVYVTERGSVIRDQQQQVTGYFGQLMDVSDQMHECSEARMAKQHRDWFIQQTTEGFYKLCLDEPVPLNRSAEQVVELIYRHAKITDCTRDLAAFCGQTVEALMGTAFEDLPGGCGFFENREGIRRFVDEGFRISGAEGVRTDSRGTPICLRYDVVGMVENDQLVSIWGTQYDISRQKREQEELKHQAAFSRRILNALPGDVFVKDPRCRYLYVSHGFKERTGIPLDDWMGKTVFEVLPAAPRDINKTSIEAMKTGKLSRTVNTRTDSGRQEWVETLEAPLVSADGVVEGVVGISMDVTDRVLRQRAEARFRHLVEHNPDGIVLADASSKRLTYANPAFCDLFGYTVEEIQTLRVADLHSPGSRRQVLAEWDARARNVRRFEEALPCLRKDHSVVFAEVRVSGGSFDGSDQVVGVYSDAAGRKQVENELERQRDLQIELLRNTCALVVTVDSSGIICSANDALLELLGQDESKLIGKPYVDTLVCEADRETLKHAFADSSPGLQTDYEYRLVAADGTLHTVACRVRTWPDFSVQAAGFTVAGTDVTPLRRLEQQLRDECGELRGRLAECEDQLSETTGACSESEQVRESLARELKQLEETQAGRVQLLEKTLAERELREAELNGMMEELETRKTGLEEALETRRKKLEQESDRREQLDELLRKTREEFSAERERIEREARKQVESQEEALQHVRTREAGLITECSRLNGRLSDAEKALQTRTEDLDARSSEWETETARRTGLCRRLEEKTVEQTKRLEQVTAERAGLESELKVSRKKAEVGYRTVQAQVKQSLEPLKQELKELHARKNKLKAAQEKTGSRVVELEAALGERMQELETVIAARKEEERSFQKTRRELKKELQLEKAKMTKLLKQTEADRSEKSTVEERWEKDRNALYAKTQELEVLLRDRTHELTFTASARQEDEQIFQKERQELTGQITIEKEKQARFLNQADESVTERCREREAWEHGQKRLKAEIQKLGKLAEERAKLLEQVTGHRAELEARWVELRAEADRQLETVDKQIDQKTKLLKQNLKIQREREETLKVEQQTLVGRLAEMQEALGRRSEEVAGLLETKQKLEDVIAREKENLAQRIHLFKEKMKEDLQDKAVWQRREEDLLRVTGHMEKQLEKRAHDVAYETGEREKAERDVARLKKAAERGHQIVYDLTEELNDPLTPVLELSESVLQDGDLPEEAHARLTEINQCARRLQAILCYRRELACLENGAICVEPGWFDFNTFLTGIADDFAERAEAKGLFFTFSRKGNLSGNICTDQAKVSLVLRVLFNHALARTSKGLVGLHTICEILDKGRKQIRFLLMYSGMEQDAVLTAGLFDPTGTRKLCREMCEEELQLDLICRKAQLLGGGLYLEHPSERKPVLHFVLPVEQEPDPVAEEAASEGILALR